MKKFTLFVLSLVTASALAQGGNVDLQGDWKVVGWTLPDAVPVRGHLPVLTFKGNKVTGTTGCNNLSGTVAISGKQVTFSPLAVTRRSCGEAVTLHENAFLKAISGKTLSVERVQDSLTLTTGDNTGMLNIRRMTIQGK